MLDTAELDAALKEAKFFLEERVFLPALQSSATSARILNVVKDTRQWISRFRKIGDLVRYMDRFRPDIRQGSFRFLDIKNLRFEDVYAEFSEKFRHFRWFKTSMADFIEGERYDPFTLSIYTRTYNNRGGGIRPVGKTGEHEAVVINITLSGGKYANEWINPFRRLKCYLKDHGTRNSSNFEEDHSSNKSIIRYPDVPILVFTRTPGHSEGPLSSAETDWDPLTCGIVG
jgi:5-methylcytosine-specific restriction enzyme A